ncbi:hypothetical protein DXG03_009290, partial [Asterophora parasitica]
GVRSMYDIVPFDDNEEGVGDDSGSGEKAEKGGEEEREDLAVPQEGKIVLIGKGLGEDVRRSLLGVLGG